MTDTPPSDCPSQGAEFDMMSALDWKDGIATLPGSDIRVRNKFVILPVFLLMPKDVKTKGSRVLKKGGWKHHIKFHRGQLVKNY